MNDISIRGIIFDKDGTLIKFDSFWRPVTEKAVMYILRKTKMPLELKDELMTVSGINDGISGLICRGTYSQLARAFEKVLEKYRKNVGDIESITIEAFTRSMPAGEIVPVCAGIEELFSKLKKSGYMIFLVTTDRREITKKCLDELRLEEFFDEIYTDDGRGYSKPDPYYINMIAEQYGLKKNELIMVGDTVTDMEFAVNGGIRAIAVASDAESRCILKKYTDTIIDDISYLTKLLGDRGVDGA